MLSIAALSIAGIGVLATGFRAFRTNQHKEQTHRITYPQNQTIPVPQKKKSWQRIHNHIETVDTSLEKLKAALPQGDQGQRCPAATQKEINQLLSISSASMAMSAVGVLLYPPLTLLTLPALVYITIPVWRDAYRSLFYKREVDFYVLHSVAQLSLMLTGHFFLTALDYTFFYIAEKLVSRTQDQAKESLTQVFSDQPRFVWLLHDGVEIETPVENLMVGDQLAVTAGQMIAVDGTIMHGHAYIDQQILTGEAQAVEKEAGDKVFAGTLILQGKIRILVEKTGKETLAAEIDDLLQRTTDFKSGVHLKGQALANRSALPLLVLGAVALPLAGRVRAITVLFSGIGDTIRISAPVSVLNFLRLSSNEGILIKDGRVLELLSKVDTIVFDKTGTLTQEIPYVGAVYTTFGTTENQVLN